MSETTPPRQQADPTPAEKAGGRRRRFRLRGQVTNLVVITLAWMLMNADASLLTILGGFGLALLITWVFPMPSIEWRGHLNPFGLVRLLAVLLWELAIASFRLAAMAFRRRPPITTGIVAARLSSDNDLYQVGTASLLSIVPGSMAVDARRKTRTLYLHVFDTSPEALGHVRQHALDSESRVLGAFASRREREEAAERRRVRLEQQEAGR